MLCFNGIYLRLSLFVVCYVQSIESDEHTHVENIPQFLYPQNSLNESTNNGDVFQTKMRNSYPSAEDSTSNSTDLGSHTERQVNTRSELVTSTRHDLVTANKQNFASPTDQPLHLGTFVYRGLDVTKNISAGKYLDKLSNNITSLAVAIVSNYHLYNVITGTTYLCNSERECKLLLDNSTCQLKPPGTVGLGICICVEGYLFEGEKCVPKGSVFNCSTHSDCYFLGNSRCTHVLPSRNVKICKCLPKHIIDNDRCLPKVSYDHYCISSKQCPLNTHCLSNYCRRGCSKGYNWKDDRCVKDYPDINLDYSSTGDSFLSSTGTFIAIVIGLFVPLALIFFTLTIVFRRRYLHARPFGPRAQENTEPCFQSAPYSTVSDRPPTYDEIMTSSTATLVANAQEMYEEPPPSYQSRLEDTPASACH